MTTLTIRPKPFAKRMMMDSQRKRLMRRINLVITPDKGGGRGEEIDGCSLSGQQSASYSERLQIPHHSECQCPPVEQKSDHDQNNNRISIMPRTRRRRKSWREFHLSSFMFYIILCNCLVQLALVGATSSFTPVAGPTPKTKSPTAISKPVKGTGNIGGSRAYSMFDSTTSRTSTSFTMGDAITSAKRLSKPSSSSTKLRNRNLSHFSNSSNNSNNYNYVSNNNAILYGTPAADRRSSKASSSSSSSGSHHHRTQQRRHRKNKMETTTPSSIDRPFYTKLTMSDAVSKSPTYYGRGTTTKRPKKGSRSKYSSSSASISSSEKYSKTRSKSKSKTKHKNKKTPKFTPMPPTPVQPHYEYNEDGMDYLGEDYPGLIMPPTTEKSYQPPKLSLEPFFNFLTSLATASREVIMSKEQQNGHQPTPGTTEEPTEDDDSKKYSEEDETEEIELEGYRKKPQKKTKKKGRRGSKERHKSSEEIPYGVKNVEEPAEENSQDEASEGSIPIPLPNSIVGDEGINNDDDGETITPMKNQGIFHILDVLRTPMIADYGSTSSTTTTTTTTTPAPLPPPRLNPPTRMTLPTRMTPPTRTTPPTRNAQPFRASPMDDIIGKPVADSTSARPPSGRSNFKEVQAPASNQGWNPSGGSGPSASREKQLRSEPLTETDPMESFSDNQAQESISHHQMVPPPSQSFSDDDLQTEQEEIPSQVNDPSMAIEGKNTAAGDKDDSVSKYPASFVYHQPPGGGQMPPGSRLYISPPSTFGPPPSPFRMNKQRPNLQSYYDPAYHRVAGAAEGQPVASEMIGLRHPYGPPHFTPPPHPHPHHHRILPSGAPPHRYMNHPPPNHHYRPGPGGFMNMLMGPHRGTHYVGHQHHPQPSSSAFANDPSQSGPLSASSPSDYEQDITSGGGNNDNGDALSSGPSSDLTGSSTDDQYGISDDNSIAEHSQTKKIGIMESFDLFYKEYKIMTWVAVFFVTSLALLSLLVYLYVNNPPTEVVQARQLQLFQWGDYLIKNNPQIVKFLSSLKRSSHEPGSTYHIQRETYMKPLGKGFGAKSGRQKRKHTRVQKDKDKQDNLLRRNISVATSSTRPILISRKRSHRLSGNTTSAGTATSAAKSRPRPLKINTIKME